MIKDVNFKVVGVQFENRCEVHKAFSTMGDAVYLEREPANPFDRNAIKVMAHFKDNTTAQLGYIGRQYVEILAPVMDKGGYFKAEVVKSGFSERIGSWFMEVKVDQVW